MGHLCMTCGKLRENPNEQICIQCKENEITDYKIIREYLSEHPRSNAIQIANHTGISISRITKLIKSGSFHTV